MVDGETIREWSRDRVADALAVVDAALPDEHLSADELLALLWDDPGTDAPVGEAGVVFGTDDRSALAAAVIRAWGEPPDQYKLAFLKLLAVHPDAQRRGLGHALMDAVERWAWDHGAAELHLTGSAPFYVWPGVDATATSMLCLAESRGYQLMGSEVNMALPTTFRCAPPEGVVLRRVVDDADLALVRALVDRHWPNWWAETERAIEHGCCHGAFVSATEGRAGDASEMAIGFCCHSVNRAGWLGPMGTDPERQTGGVGSALLAQVCRDLMIAEFDVTEISWVGPLRFYGKNGATVSRVFRSYKKPAPAPT